MPLPVGKTYAEALTRAIRYRRELWECRLDLPEDVRIDMLDDYCCRLYGGDKTEGRKLAADAVWRDEAEEVA